MTVKECLVHLALILFISQLPLALTTPLQEAFYEQLTIMDYRRSRCGGDAERRDPARCCDRCVAARRGQCFGVGVLSSSLFLLFFAVVVAVLYLFVIPTFDRRGTGLYPCGHAGTQARTARTPH